VGGDMHGERGEDGALDVVAELSEVASQGGARWVDVALDTVGYHQEMVAVLAGVLLVFLVGHGSAE